MWCSVLTSGGRSDSDTRSLAIRRRNTTIQGRHGETQLTCRNGFGDAIVTLLDTSTGERHFDGSNLPDVGADAIEASAAPEIWTDDWIIQRSVRIRVASAGGDVHEPWPGYTHPMTRDQAVKALEECEARWPEHEFRAHQLRLEEKVAADAIDRARRSVRSWKYD